MKRLTVFAAALVLSACTTVPRVSPAPIADITAPIRASNVDERSIQTAFKTYDTLLSAVDLLVAFKVVDPGTQRAKSIAGALRIAKHGLNAAANAQRAGNSTTALEALAHAEAALGAADALLKEIKR